MVTGTGTGVDSVVLTDGIGDGATGATDGIGIALDVPSPLGIGIELVGAVEDGMGLLIVVVVGAEIGSGPGTSSGFECGAKLELPMLLLAPFIGGGGSTEELPVPTLLWIPSSIRAGTAAPRLMPSAPRIDEDDIPDEAVGSTPCPVLVVGVAEALGRGLSQLLLVGLPAIDGLPLAGCMLPLPGTPP